MPTEKERLCLERLGGGAALELFDNELSRVLANIVDPNTRAKTRRVVALMVTFAPNEDRDYAGIEIQCKAKLAPSKGYETNAIVLTNRDGSVVATEHDPKQMRLGEEPPAAAGPHVVTLAKKEASA